MRMPGQDRPQGRDAVSFGPFSLFATERLLLDGGKPINLGGRAFDILLALVERAGQVVSKSDLIERVWPDATVDEGSLRFHIASLRKALGDGELGARYVTTLKGRGYCFIAPVSRASVPESSTAQEPVSRRADRLPARLSRMFGREETVQQLSAQVKTERFVTVVGPGGIGKTTVAVAAGQMLLPDFEGAVFFFDLGSLNDPLLVPSAVASALGLLVQSADPIPGLIAYLGDKRTLLVLDSCEHVIEPIAALAERIFSEAPQVHILATSREALRVDGEHVQLLMPLDSPPDQPGLTAAQVLRFSAAQLFVERVRESGYPFELDDTNAPVVAEICRGLDGIALAIELAAGRVNAYGVEEIATHLNGRLNLLWEGRRTALPRHQTLSATLDWSHDLLHDNERVVLRRLAILVGVFTLEAGRSIAAGADIDEAQVSTALAGLVAKSLVLANTRHAATRYRLLDTTRAYALGKLHDSGEMNKVARCHAAYFLGLLERADAGPPLEAEDKVFASFGEHLGNVRAALKWSLFERGDVGVGIGLAAASAGLFLELSLLTECNRWTERAVTALDEATRGTRLEMQLQAAFGLSSMLTRGNSEQAIGAMKRGLVLAANLGDLHNEFRLLARLHIFHERSGDFRAALEYARQSEAVAARIANPVGIAQAHSTLGISLLHEGNAASARVHLDAALMELPASTRADTFQFGSRGYWNRTRMALARALWLQGSSHRAVTTAQETVEEAETSDHPITLCIALIWAVSVYLWNRDFDLAEQCADKLVEQAGRHSLVPYQAVGRGAKGELLVRRGQPEPGVARLRGALEILRGLRYELFSAPFMTAIAEGLATMGRFEEATNAIDETIAAVERNGNLFLMPELLRVKGSILMQTQAEPFEAEDCFLRSLDLAAGQGALAWELRTATSLAMLRAGQGRRDEARLVLAPVYQRFTEGFDNFDLTAARLLLRDLG